MNYQEQYEEFLNLLRINVSKNYGGRIEFDSMNQAIYIFYCGMGGEDDPTLIKIGPHQRKTFEKKVRMFNAPDLFEQLWRAGMVLEVKDV